MEEGRPSPRVLALSLLGVAFFLAWQALALRSYLRAESRPPVPEAVASLQATLDYDRGPAQAWAALFCDAPATLPPLYHRLLQRLLGTDRSGRDVLALALWLNWGYLAALSLCLFGLAWHFRPDETALLSVLVFVGCPAVQEAFHAPGMACALVACVAAAYWALLLSDEFRRWAGSLAFAALFAVGMLHHWSFAAYFLPVLYIGGKALTRSSSRPKVLAAVLLALAGFVPWYAGHLPLLLPQWLRDPGLSLAAPWRGWTALSLLGQMADGLSLPFFALGLVGLCFPQYRTNWHRGWVMVGWFLSSYFLWAFAPQAPLRWLLPALPALAVAGLGAWPRAVLYGLAAFQLLTMVNFSSGLLPPMRLPLPVTSVMLWPSQPPARQDWHIAEILREAQGRRQAQRPWAGLTVVAGAERFNPATFAWVARQAGLESLRVRPADERVCEFSEFVILKEGAGDEGPAEAAKVVGDPKGWFAQAYGEVRRWPLPDGSSAVLYQQRSRTSAPVPGGRYRYQFFAAGPIEATDLVLEFGGWDPQQSAFLWGKASAAEVRAGSLRLPGLQLEAQDLAFQPLFEHGSNTWGDLRLLRLGQLRIKSLRLEGDGLRAFLESRVPGLRVAELVLGRPVRLRGRLGPVPLALEASLSLQSAPPALRLDVLQARLGESPVPGFLLDPYRSFVLPLTPTVQAPFEISLPGLTLAGDHLSVP